MSKSNWCGAGTRVVRAAAARGSGCSEVHSGEHSTKQMQRCSQVHHDHDATAMHKQWIHTTHTRLHNGKAGLESAVSCTTHTCSCSCTIARTAAAVLPSAELVSMLTLLCCVGCVCVCKQVCWYANVNVCENYSSCCLQYERALSCLWQDLHCGENATEKALSHCFFQPFRKNLFPAPASSLSTKFLNY